LVEKVVGCVACSQDREVSSIHNLQSFIRSTFQHSGKQASNELSLETILQCRSQSLDYWYSDTLVGGSCDDNVKNLVACT
jgi:hypothetical protein